MSVASRTAVPVEAGPDAGRPWHYGDPVGEQRSWLAGRGLVDLGHRGVVRVDGPDRLSWLDSITSQALGGLAAGVSTESLVLTPHGHVEHALHVVDDGDEHLVDGRAGHHRRPRRLARPDALPAPGRGRRRRRRSGPSSRSRPETASSVAGVGSVSWVDPWPTVAPGSVSYADDSVPHPAAACGTCVRCWCPRADVAGVVARRPRSPPASGPSRRCGSRRAAPGWASRPTTGPSRTRSTGCGRRCTCRRAATAARRPSPGCTTWGARRDVWCCSTSTAPRWRCRRTATTYGWRIVRSASSPPPRGTTSWAGRARSRQAQRPARRHATSTARPQPRKSSSPLTAC